MNIENIMGVWRKMKDSLFIWTWKMSNCFRLGKQLASSQFQSFGGSGKEAGRGGSIWYRNANKTNFLSILELREDYASSFLRAPAMKVSAESLA